MPWLDRSLDVVLATHYDLDHIGGLVDVLERYEVETIVKTANENDTTATDAFLSAVEHESATIHVAMAGDELQLGASTTFIVLSPVGDPTEWESNNASIVGLLRYGEIEVLLTGDAGTGIEEYLVRTYGTALRSEVLKLGHHGSNTSSSETFLTAVQPALAIVSAGADNRYGHPHPAVVARAEAVGARTLSTADEGTIVLKSDGKRVWVE
jgi:competence protein ComEC